MSALFVSVVVFNQSELIENELTRVETVFATKEEAERYRLDIEEWIANIPTPDGKKSPAQAEKTLYRDEASELAAKLVEIIPPRDADIFRGYAVDREGEAARVERRPYDHDQLEAV